MLHEAPRVMHGRYTIRGLTGGTPLLGVGHVFASPPSADQHAKHGIGARVFTGRDGAWLEASTRST